MRTARLVVFSPLPKDYRPLCLQNKNALVFGKIFLAIKWLYIFSTPSASPLVFFFLLSEPGVGGHHLALRRQRTLEPG